MPRIIQITFGRTYNDGNFESTRLDLAAELGVNEDYEDAFQDLLNKMQVLRNRELDYVPTLKEELPRRRRRE